MRLRRIAASRRLETAQPWAKASSTACGESATYSLFSGGRHARRGTRWHAVAGLRLPEIFVSRAIAEISRSNVYSQDDRSIRTGRFGKSRRSQATPTLRAGDV